MKTYEYKEIDLSDNIDNHSNNINKYQIYYNKETKEEDLKSCRQIIKVKLGIEIS